jgi:hypothetical protein
MWPFSKSNPEKVIQLREVLEQIKGFVERSGESDWTPFTPAEVSAGLGTAISQLERGEAIDVDHLKMLFAPTGPLQEIAMSSDWATDYLTLSSKFDDLIPNA